MIIKLRCKQAIGLGRASEVLDDNISMEAELKVADKYMYLIEVPNDFYNDENLLRFAYDLVRSVLSMLPEGSCEVKEIEISRGVLEGPSFGKSGFKRYMGVRGPAIAATVGLGAVMHPLNHAKLFHRMCAAGLDVGFDPLHLGDDNTSPYYDRAHQVVEISDAIKDDTGRRVLYFMRTPKEDLLEKVVSIGLKGIYVDLCSDLGRLSSLLEFKGKVFLAARNPECLQLRGGLPLSIVYELLKGIGFDLIERPVINDRRGLERIKKLESEIGSGEGASMPLTSPGIHPGNIITNIPSDLGVVLFGDLGIYGHPQGLIKGVSSLRDTLDSFMRGENLLSVMRRNKAVEAVVERWGYLLP